MRQKEETVVSLAKQELFYQSTPPQRREGKKSNSEKPGGCLPPRAEYIERKKLTPETKQAQERGGALKTPTEKGKADSKPGSGHAHQQRKGVKRQGRGVASDDLKN